MPQLSTAELVESHNKHGLIDLLCRHCRGSMMPASGCHVQVHVDVNNVQMCMQMLMYRQVKIIVHVCMQLCRIHINIMDHGRTYIDAHADLKYLL